MAWKAGGAAREIGGLAMEGARILAYVAKRRSHEARRYGRTAREACEAIIKECWDEELGYYRTSLNNYRSFYARDFGMCAESLLALGEREKVRRTLRRALAAYQARGKVTQQVSPSGEAFDYPRGESDALAYLLRALHALNEKRLVREYRGFLEREVRRFTAAVVDPASGLVKRGVTIAGMRDYALRVSGCYENAIVGAVKRYASLLGLRHGLRHDYQRLLLKRFWTSTHFADDLERRHCTGDANTIPFWFQLFSKRVEQRLFPLVKRRVKEEGLDEPLALRYEGGIGGRTRMRRAELLVPGWERGCVWLHLGTLWISVLTRLDEEEARRQLARHDALIGRLRHYPEVLTPKGEPYRSAFFHADEAMLWAANHLVLAAKLLGRSRNAATPPPRLPPARHPRRGR